MAHSVRRVVLGADYDVLHGHYPISMLPGAQHKDPLRLHLPFAGLQGSSRGTTGAYQAPGPVSDATVAGNEGRRAPDPRTGVSRGHAERLHRRRDARAITRPGKTTWQKIPGGLKTDYFSPLPRLEPPLDMPRPIILTARRLVERTGVELLVAAMPEILAAHPTAQLVVTGDGPRRAATHQFCIGVSAQQVPSTQCATSHRPPHLRLHRPRTSPDHSLRLKTC